MVCEEAQKADTPLARMIGLLNRSEILPHQGLLITKCNSIHMFFMKFSIDVLFVSRDHQVVGLVKGIKPFRLSRTYFTASYALELAPGAIDNSQTEVGDQLELEG